MKKWLLIGLGTLFGLIVMVYVIGLLLPRDHRATVTFDMPRSPEEVWQFITEIDRFPTWRTEVDNVEMLPARDGLPAWTEYGPGGTLPLYVESMDPPRTLVIRIGEGLPFGGTWTYELDPVGATSTNVTITEDGEVYSPIFRFVGRFFIGYDATLNRYRDALMAAVD
jgi:uncharacterized protein YndB with AHSA1/START domain